MVAPVVFGNRAITVHNQILWFAVPLTENLDLRVDRVCWPLSTNALSDECSDTRVSKKTLESVTTPLTLLAMLACCQLA